MCIQTFGRVITRSVTMLCLWVFVCFSGAVLWAADSEDGEVEGKEAAVAEEEDPKAPGEGEGEEVKEDVSPDLNRDPKEFYKAVTDWFDAHTEANTPKPPEPKEGEEAKEDDKPVKLPKRKLIEAEVGAKQLVQDLAKTQHPAFMKALKREAELLYRVYNLQIRTEQKMDWIEGRLEVLRPQRLTRTKGKATRTTVNCTSCNGKGCGICNGKGKMVKRKSGLGKTKKNMKVIKQVKELEDRRRDTIELQRDLAPALRLLAKRVASKPEPIGKDDNLNRYFSAAIDANALTLVEMLIERGVDVNEPINGIPPVMIAINNESRKCLDALLQHKPDLNAKDRFGMLPLHRAVELGDRNLVKLLLEAGADPEARARGRTPDMYADDEDRKMRALFDEELAAEIKAEEEEKKREREEKRKKKKKKKK